MFQFNSKKLISLCRKLIGMIEDNRIAEELTDKISGIELKYTSKWETANKWHFRVNDMVDIFNSKCQPDEIIKFVITNYEYGNRVTFSISNRFNNIRKDFIIYPEDSKLAIQESFFEFVFNIITERGICYYFSKKSPVLSRHNGEESFNVTHS